MARMSSRIPARLAREVRRRAGDVCEYCLLPQNSQEATFHIDHIVPRSRGGATTFDNLALACVSCSLRKSARDRGRDPATGKLAPFFNPRSSLWRDHFGFTKLWRIRGRTPAGRATIEALRMNRTVAVLIRRQLAELRKFPPANA
jgi:5-methylcytosine-specific restriction endonuclease McrA